MTALLKVTFAVALVWIVYFLRGNVYFRLYPAVVSAAALMAFAVSSFKTPLVETIARRRGEKLDEAGVKYCRNVNSVWVGFLFVHFCVTLATVFGSIKIWAFYNGFFAYVLMGSLFLAEFIYRRKMKGGR